MVNLTRSEFLYLKVFIFKSVALGILSYRFWLCNKLIIAEDMINMY